LNDKNCFLFGSSQQTPAKNIFIQKFCRILKLTKQIWENQLSKFAILG